MNAKTNTTTTTARWFTDPDRERIADQAASRNAGSYWDMPPAPEDEGDALRAGLNTATVQIGGLRADLGIAEEKARLANVRAGNEYVRGLNRAGALLRQAAEIKADDTVGEFADYLAHQIEQAVVRAKSTVVPDPAPALPEVPGDRTETKP